MDAIIYGSCVTRDMFDLANSGNDVPLRYIARQSWCSVGQPVLAPPTSLPNLGSAFLTRALASDMAGDALDQIASAATMNPQALLLMDLTDERGGFFEGPDGQIMTFNVDAAKHGVYDDLPALWQKRHFGSDKYALALFEATVRLERALEKAGLAGRTAVIGTYWAAVDSDGAPVTDSVRGTARMNSLLGEVYSFLRERGWTVLDVDAEPVADASHRWGPAPFHYMRDYYRAMRAAVADFETRSSTHTDP